MGYSKANATAREKNREHQRKWRRDHPDYDKLQKERHWVQGLVDNARKTVRDRTARRGEPVTILAADLKAIFDMQGGKCYWLGLPMEFTARSHYRVSLDRLDNAKGYTRNNVVLCTWFANRARGTMSSAAFRLAIDRLRAA